MEKKPLNNTLGFLFSALLRGPDKAVTDQEAEGQSSLVESDTFPTDMGPEGYDSKKILEAAGVKFLGVVAVEGRFPPELQYVQLPDGWKKCMFPHHLYYYIVDSQGRERALIFQERRAYLSLCRRYTVKVTTCLDEGKVVANVIDDRKNIIFRSEATIPAIAETETLEAEKTAKIMAFKWLDKNYPDWENPGAYWD